MQRKHSFLHYLACTMVGALAAGSVHAQVSYTQSWTTTGLNGWIDGNPNTNATAWVHYTGNPSCDGASVNTHLNNPGGARGLRSQASLGTSQGGVTTLTFDYKAANGQGTNTPYNVVGVAANTFTLEAFWGTAQNGPWTSIGIINADNHVVSNTCAPAPGTYTFTPTAGSPVFIRFVATRVSTAGVYVTIDNVSVQEIPPVICTATPAPGATVSSSAFGCVGGTVDLNVANPSTDLGISYQWYSSTDGGANWLANGPTTATWSGVVILAETQFYVRATCAGQGAANSTPVTVPLGNFAQCGNYCETGVGNNLTDRSQVFSVALAGESSSINYVFNNCPVGTVWVVDLLDHQADLMVGETYTLEVDFNTCHTTPVMNSAGHVWIDYDQNATFAPGETIGSVFGALAVTANSAFTFTVPDNAVLGHTRMRVTQNGGNPDLPLDPCFGGPGFFSWGSVLDFTVNILENDSSLSVANHVQQAHTPLQGWPVPAATTLQLDRMVTATLHDATGRTVGTVRRTNVVNIQHLPSGPYVLRTDKGEVLRFMRE